MSERDITIAATLGDLRRRAWLIVAIAAGAAGLAFAASQLQPERYEATTNLLFSGEQSNAPERTAATNLALATLDTVVVRVQRDFSRDFTLGELRGRVSIAPKGQADIVEVKAQGDTRAQAVRLADAFATQIVAVRVERAQAVRERSIGAIDEQLAKDGRRDQGVRRALIRRKRDLLVEQALEDGDVSAAGQAFAPAEPSQPRPLRNAAVGGGAGLLFALLLAMGLRERGRELDETEIAMLTQSPVLARVPRRGRGWREEAFLEAIQFLRINLSRAREQAPGPQVVAVTSPRPGDGKSLIVEHLSVALASAGQSVVVVDADLRRGALAMRFGVGGGAPGLAQALAGEPPNLLAGGHPGLRLLARGEHSAHALSRLDTASLGRVLGALRSQADIVLVDTAPVSIAAETSDIVAIADAVVLVVDVAGGDTASVGYAHAQLVRADAELVGIVLNRCEGARSRRDRAAYMDYGVRAAAATHPPPPGAPHEDGAAATPSDRPG